jgi:hypothetical protein
MRFGESNCSILGDSATASAANLVFYTGNAERMRITAAGNLCIGTTSASVKLRVESADADYISVLRNTNASGYGLQVLTQGSSTNLAFQVRTNNANTNAFQVLDNGNVGIGTSSPSVKLEVIGNLTVGSSGNGDQVITTLQGYSPNSVNGSYGRLLFSANSNYTGGAGRYLLTNALDYTKFAIICSVDATTTPTLDVNGAVSSGTAAFVINTNATAIFNSVISVGAATPTTSGAGITFPATQQASSDANTLDDYEEGTWTPTVTLNTGTATTYTIGTATYTKTGRVVVVIGSIIPTNGTFGSTNGYARMTGLPFTVGTRSGAGSGGNISALTNGVATTFAYSTTVDVAFTSGVTSTNEFAFTATYFV